MLLEPDEMVSASFINRNNLKMDVKANKLSKYDTLTNDIVDGEDVPSDIILMRKCLSTACQKRKGRMHGRGVWATNDYWITTPIIVLASLFLIVTCVLSLYRSRFVKYACVRIILWMRRKSRTHSM